MDGQNSGLDADGMPVSMMDQAWGDVQGTKTPTAEEVVKQKKMEQ